ncbi:MAG TPA: DUF4097 family beta strand repeat-containing protein [Anaerolineales bacterium]|nr:DUF4097 family beta strand repeat-containing protein [Anaerolineales bacterium]
MKGKWIIAGGLLLAELVLCAGMMVSIWAGVIGLGRMQIRLGSFFDDTTSATAEEEERFEVDGPATVNVNKGNLAAFGDVTVIGGLGDEIVVTAHKAAWGADTTSAENDLANLKVIVTQNGDVIDVRVERPESMSVFTLGNTRPDKVDFTITAPVETSVYLVTDFGDLSVSGTEGSVHLDTNFGKIEVTEVTGGDIDVRSDFGEIKLESVEADDVEAHSNAGEIIFDGVRASGEVSISTDFGEVDVDGGTAKTLFAKTNSGDVTVQNVNVAESISARSEFGQVRVVDVAGESYELNSNSGGITLEGATGPVTAHTDFGDVTVTGGVEVTLDLSTNSGNVEFAGSLSKGLHTISTDFGQITLKLPDDSELTVDLQTEFGRIKSDLPITLSGDQEENHWQGEINGGGAELTATTNSGNITIQSFEP